MRNRTVALTAFLFLMGTVIAAGTASAHATAYTPDGKVKFVYGNLGEPVYTFQKTGLDLGIYDNRTGASITGLEAVVGHGDHVTPKLTIGWRYGAQGGPALDFSKDLTAQFGKPGWYTYPVMYTKPGLYYLSIKGSINGTMVDQTITPLHEIKEMKDIMWPDKVGQPSDQDARIMALESKVEAMKSTPAKSPGPDVALLLGVGLMVLVVLRRRP
jgi:hypothetical protein